MGREFLKILIGQVSPDLHTSIGTPEAGINVFLLLKAFTSGSSALTGVEAISQGATALMFFLVIAIHVSFDREGEKNFEQEWQPDIRLVSLHSHYRSLIHSLTKFVDIKEHKASEFNYQDSYDSTIYPEKRMA